jgi:CheY-like chemotaxis protein
LNSGNIEEWDRELFNYNILKNCFFRIAGFPAMEAPSGRKNLKILVVDEETTLHSVEALLKECSYEGLWWFTASLLCDCSFLCAWKTWRGDAFSLLAVVLARSRAEALKALEEQTEKVDLILADLDLAVRLVAILEKVKNI